MAIEIWERASVVKYPLIQVYSDRVRNLLTEKFRTFSGKVRTVAEVRVSQDRIEGLEDQLRLYVDAVTQILDANRGNWGQGVFYHRRIRGDVRSGEAGREELSAGGEGDVRSGHVELKKEPEAGSQEPGEEQLCRVIYRRIMSGFTVLWNPATG